MSLDELLAGLFPEGHDVIVSEGIATGTGPIADGAATVIGIADGTPLGVEGALSLAGAVLDAVERGGAAPILVLIDSGSQRMRRRDEMLGLSEYLAHLAKALRLAEAEGHPTLAIIHGHSAAGAFIATALAAQILVGLPDANPTVMDLPSIARVTGLPLKRLEALAESTPVFAPGIENMVAVGAVRTLLSTETPIGDQIRAILADLPKRDERDLLGAERGGRPRAAEIARRIVEAARAE